MSKKIFIIAGHSKSAPGAMGYDGITEHERTTKLQELVVQGIDNAQSSFGTDMGVEVDDDGLSLSRVVNWINQESIPGSLGIDIHFNNNNPKATGTEIIVHPNTSAENKRRATWIVNNVSRVIDIPLRRRQSGRDYIFPSETYVGKLAIIEKIKIPMILLEVCFLNERDLTKYNGKEELVAHIIRQGMFFLDFSKEGSENQLITLPNFQTKWTESKNS